MKLKKSYLKIGLNTTVLLGLGYAILKYVNGPELARAAQAFTTVHLLLLLALALAYFLSRAGRFMLLMSPFADNVGPWVILKGYVSGQAVALLPGGIAARAGLMKQVGVPVTQSSVPVTFHSGWDQVLFLLGGTVAAIWFPAARLPVLIIAGLLMAATLVLIIPATRESAAKAAKLIAGRFNQTERWLEFLRAIPLVTTRKIVLGSFVITVVTFALQLIILEMALRRLALEVPLPALFLAFSLPTMLGRIIPVPGGLGVTEAGMVGLLTSTAQLSLRPTVAAVAIFRVLTIVIPAAVGAIVYFLFWKGESEAEDR